MLLIGVKQKVEMAYKRSLAKSWRGAPTGQREENFYWLDCLKKLAKEFAGPFLNPFNEFVYLRMGL